MARLAGLFEVKPMATPNLAPLIGVLLAVTAGIALASTGERAEQLSLAPPPLQACKCMAPFIIHVGVKGEAVRFTDGDRVLRSGAPDDLSAIVADLKRSRSAYAAVMIQADPDASHADVMRVYRAVRASGERRVQFSQTPDWALLVRIDSPAPLRHKPRLHAAGSPRGAIAS